LGKMFFMRYLVIGLIFIIGCKESDDTKKHRFLLKGNAALAKQNYTLATNFFKEAIRIDPCFADAHNNIGTALFRQKNFAESLEFYNQAISCNSKFVSGYINRANTFYELNRLPEALKDTEIVLALKPDTLPALFLIGLIQTRLTQYDKAQRTFEEMLVKDSLNVEILINLGTLAYYQKNYSKAEFYLLKAIGMAPAEANSYNTLALVHAAQYNLDTALVWIEKALKLKPHDSFFNNNRGYIYLLKNELSLALEDINFSIALDPYNAWAYRNKGIYFLKKNDADYAIRLITKGLKIDDYVESGYYYLAQAYSKSGDNRNACNAFARAVELSQAHENERNLYCK
jgi:tetratricopeptide (TPR) repeat protein